MSLKGGYQIIDLKFKPFDSREGTSHTFPELFNDLKNSNAKMIIISGLNMDGVKYNDYDVIFYEVEENNEPMYYQAVLRRIWTPIDYTCTTKYVSIYNDDKVKITQDTFIYEILPDDEMSETSENALQNKVITQAFNEDRNRLTALEKLQPTYLKLDGSRKMLANLDMGAKHIINLQDPTGNYTATNKRYVDNSIKALKDSIKFTNYSYTIPTTDRGCSVTFNFTIFGIKINITKISDNYNLQGSMIFSVPLVNELSEFYNTSGLTTTNICNLIGINSDNLTVNTDTYCQIKTEYYGQPDPNSMYVTVNFYGTIENLNSNQLVGDIAFIPA